MANDTNHVVLIARFARDPELKFTPNNTPIANFSLANNHSYSSGNGEKKETVNFFSCICWGKGGQLISQYCHKGDKILVEGRLQQRSWNDKDGNKRYAVEIVVEKFQFLGSPQKSDQPQSAKPEQNTGVEVQNYEDLPETNPFDDSDLPF
jgi:single-strand DNA-binding protein